jgi:hypothetical protein
MGTITPFRRPVNWTNLRTDEAESIVRARSSEKNTDLVVFSEHAWERVSEREITRGDIFDILRNGYCHGQPHRNEKGHWQVIISKRLTGQREAGAVTVILEEIDRLIIRTVQWMDPK